MVDVARRTAEEVFIPFTIGGGIRRLDDARRLLRAGADKVSVNTSAVERPGADRRAVGRVRRPVRGVRHRREGPRATAPAGRSYVHGGRTPTGLDVLAWAAEAVQRGAGEILLTSMDRDGTRDGYDLRADARRGRRRERPRDRQRRGGHARAPRRGVVDGGADAVLAASIFHFGEHTVAEAKAVMAAAGITVRPAS